MKQFKELREELISKFNLQNGGDSRYKTEVYNYTESRHSHTKLKDGTRKVRWFFSKKWLKGEEGVKECIKNVEEIRSYLIQKGIKVKEGYVHNTGINFYGLEFYIKD
jgi:hypothetical protein